MGTASMEQDQYQRHQGSAAHATSRVKSPSPAQLRHRQNSQLGSNLNGGAASPFTPERLRRSSTFSDAVSETRRSIQSSTDDLFFPRANGSMEDSYSHNTDSPWHSSPLALALLPALGGLLFQNGTAVFTDIALLALAAVFLNWSVRLPWDWYFAAQERVQLESAAFDTDDLDLKERDDGAEKSSEIAKGVPSQEMQDNDNEPRVTSRRKQQTSTAYKAARRELQTHELAALASCFLFPVLATYLLHTIRYQLSRPSEGLISNYNLTLFLLAAEIRPISHLLRMVQARTLHLQRVVEWNKPRTDSEKIPESGAILELSRRLEEIESRLHPENSHFTIAEEDKSASIESNRDIIVAEVRKSIQEDIDTLNRVVRRQEKRCNVASVKLEARLRTVDSYMAGLDPLIAAGKQERLNGSRPRYRFKYDPLLKGVIAAVMAIIVPPLRIAWSIAMLPTYPLSWAYYLTMQLLRSRENQHTARKLRTTRLPRREIS
ncbi:uncharacterized protein GIQ15_06087 [Arthroderma uncinatum]|uniref:uncharacterized protein n=1 Tax=Arthroderma uncinatum TaxID=74035 RepID=UPI00144A6B53|nr:uncharacterized protein GIQ15_06087 [Arthroderma uncinatum]KAF3480740.1 hypothetical protein GIQ15_06087 [Arthroderma uncinatum]